MATALSLSLDGSNYSDLSTKDKRLISKPSLAGDTWSLTTKSKRVSEGLKVKNFDKETVDISKAKFTRLDFRYDTAEGGAAKIESSQLSNSKFNAGNGVSRESLVFGAGSFTADTKANLGKGDDLLSFQGGSGVKGQAVSVAGTYNLGEGSDTAVFGTGVRVRAGNKVDLGKDSNVDVVEIANSADVKGLVVSNFGSNDVLKIGGTTYNAADIAIRKGNVDGVIIKSQNA